MSNRPDKLNRAIIALLLAGLGLRLALVWGGGQFFWPDESRYVAAQDAMISIADGRVMAGLTSLVAQGDHVGFKLLGLLPAAVERMTGVQDPRLAAGFFSLFSWMGLIFLWLWARRLGASPAAQAWTVLLAVTCTTLTFYTRHLFPYDPSLALALAALLVGAKENASLPRLAAAGALTGCAVLVYFGYWLLAGVVLILIGLGQKESWGRRCLRGVAAGLGFASVLLAVWLLDRCGAGTMVTNARNFSGTVFQGDFDQGYRLVWEYFWHTEGLGVLLWLGAGFYAARRAWCDFRGARELPPAWALGVLALGLVYAGLVLTSDVMHKFVVYGRSARQLAPFFCLVGGLALAEWFAGRGRRAAWLVAGVLAANAAWHLGPVFTQVFPKEFRRLGAVQLATVPPAEPGRSYYRYVNVDHYVFEPEVLPHPPEATLLVRLHPYEFAPYLYEGSSAQQRALRRATDQRMRLVRVRVPDEWLVGGGTEGMITMKVRFAPGRGGMAEPLLSLGAKGAGDLFFVRYLDDRLAMFGMESVGDVVVTSSPVEYTPGEEYELAFFSGSLMPLPGPAAKARPDSQRLYYENLVSVRRDGREILTSLVSPHAVRADEIYVGYNQVRANSADTAFRGAIRQVVRGGYPPLPAGGLGDADFGAARMVVWLPAAAAGVPEPLLVVGSAGQATLGYVRVLPGGQVRLGTEFWGVGVAESDAVAAPPEVATEIVFHFPALYPPVGDARWGAVPRAEQEARRARVTILLNGRVVLDQEAKATAAPSSPVVFGKNPVGGSWVGERFTGRLMQGMRLPLSGP